MLPREDRLPKGPHRTFVEEMFLHYREAGRPTLRSITAWIDKKNDETELGASASIETVRRVMNGSTIPRNWKTVEVIFLALCDIGGRDADEPRWEEGYDSPTFKEALKRCWNDALDAQTLTALPARAQPQAASPSSSFDDDPWASASPSSSSSFDDEPPF